MSENILEIRNLSKYFGGLAAVSDCSLKVKRGTITGIIGPNGSGKTTLFNLIAGNLKSSAGSVMFNNVSIHSNVSNIATYIGPGNDYCYFYTSRSSSGWITVNYSSSGNLIANVSYRTA